MRLFYEPMGTVLGLLGVAVFIPCVVGLAALLTWLVVKISPAPGTKPEQS
jgi:hypothetical protein